MFNMRLFLIFYFLQFAIFAKGSNVLLFNQDCNVDAAGADNTCADERYNIINILIAEGHTVTTLPDFHQANMLNLLNSHDFFLIPDLEDISTCDVFKSSFINSGEKMILKHLLCATLVAGLTLSAAAQQNDEAKSKPAELRNGRGKSTAPSSPASAARETAGPPG